MSERAADEVGADEGAGPAAALSVAAVQRLQALLGAPSPDTSDAAEDGLASWLPLLRRWGGSATAAELWRRLVTRLEAGAVVYPPDILRALRLTPLPAVKVVIVGQDPYHGAGQAEGLAFSVADGQRWPPSLRNILHEVRRDVGAPLPPAGRGSLQPWARQGVLLLNTSLTVEAGRPASHAGLGWHALTAGIVTHLHEDPAPRVFLLWGAHAQALASGWPRRARHAVLQANHPSPLSARRPPVPFLGCGHFSQANAHLQAAGMAPVDWALP